MKYSHDYSKLKKDHYTTIRRYPKGKINDIVAEIHPSGRHYAQIWRILRRTLASISIDVLIADTGLESRKEIYELFQSFYRKPIDFHNDTFYIYYMKKVNKNE